LDEGRAAPARAASSAIREKLVDAAVVVAVWAGCLVAENTALALLWPQQFSGAWEIALARYAVVPLAIVGLAPASLVVVALWHLAEAAGPRGRGTSTWVLGLLGAIAWGALALGISNGRHFASLAVRAPFVVLLGLTGALVGSLGVPRVTSLSRRPLVLAALGLLLAMGAWVADGYMLPRLYPAFHLALFALTLLSASLVGFAVRGDVLTPGYAANLAAIAVAALLAVCAGSVRKATATIDRASNLRVVLVEHAPLLGRAVEVETWLHPEAPEDAPVVESSMGPIEIARSLDWTGRDCLLLTVDALRADHVGAYAYARPTTPNIDALSREGATFDSAYCPTPHTSYSVTSMMTGKYLRPLLALGLGQDSESWADYLRRYGWRTAAFYPPAVFFIDESRFSRFEQEHLGFEYAKIEFADPVLRESQVASYLAGAPAGRPLFLWVHFFEPHEPYVMHDTHPFSGGASSDIDAYDSEVAAADEGIGRVLRLVRQRRPGAVVIVTADHGEEFGEHGGRYHGTTVYEEQVRVPMVIVAPGVRAGARLPTVVQTIDLLPTTLSALGIPRPARLRGRDLGPVLTETAPAGDPGLALSETDDYSLLASGDDRLVCDRRAGACAMYHPKSDPAEQHDRAVEDPERAGKLRATLRSVERDHGRYESIGGPAWPEALRRGMQGDVDAAEDVASLLDDADVTMRRKAAQVCFELRAPAAIPGVKRAFAKDEDAEVRRWSALALVRMGEPISPVAEALLHDGQVAWRRPAAQAIAERGSGAACDELAAWWGDVAPEAGESRADGEPLQLSLDLLHARQLLDATAQGHCRMAVGALIRALGDVRARPYVADALGSLGDARAGPPLSDLVSHESNVTSRQHEVAALHALGVSVAPIDRPASSK
jgi:arylsulfatase A-like enzyme